MLTSYVFAVVTADGCFILAFARRNVKIDKVFAAAEQRGLQWRIVDDSPEGAASVEPILEFTFRK
jgi:hypothetical protein